MTQKSQPRTIVYVDGFNFYCGAVKGTSLKWLDYRALAEALLRGHQIDAVKYFTARVQDRPDDLGLSQRQDDYIRALEAPSAVEVHYGHFRRRRVPRPIHDQTVASRPSATWQPALRWVLGADENCCEGGKLSAFYVACGLVNE
ncbi:MAG: hypothetical protein ACE367_22210 [Acidimicrobiales bacterium]